MDKKMFALKTKKPERPLEHPVNLFEINFNKKRMPKNIFFF